MRAACLLRPAAHQVKPAAMDVDDWPQQLADHGAAFQVPPWAPLPPGTLPGGLPWLCCFPERKVGRAALAAVYSHPFPRPVVFLHQEVQKAAVQRSQLAGLRVQASTARHSLGLLRSGIQKEEGGPPGLPEASVGRAMSVGAQCCLIPQTLLNCNLITCR